jgi:hypothetical protein
LHRDRIGHRERAFERRTRALLRKRQLGMLMQVVTQCQKRVALFIAEQRGDVSGNTRQADVEVWSFQ